ncbi:MAG: murein DD-endopeptidase MepM/ murein hydrolase activator NlpD [Candidatus Azotimanducaceae bacterium]|jgi:murein DD-endopeptidase MepM/ murein hydrolase activator NlpD
MNTYPRSHLKAALLLALALIIALTALPAYQQAPAPAPISLKVVPEPTTIAAPAMVVSAVVSAPVIEVNTSQWVTITIKPGDNLARIFQRMDLPAADLQAIVDLGADAKSLRKVMPGQELEFNLSVTGELNEVRYKKNVFETLHIERSEMGFQANWESATPDKRIVFETAQITRQSPSLYHAGKSAGLTDNVIMKLSYIFQWDISFALDLREGDSFSVMYEQIFIDGKKVKEGDILAATFVNAGRTHEAVRYTNIAGKTSFYTPSGMSMRKAFLRDPVHFSHVSSSFNLRRLHPIHKRVMPHRGIDYAANRGTPVLAAGDGKVKIRRENSAAGKFVVIQHGEQYTTKYLHLSRFAKGLNPGTSVSQGDIIGYVGATGWATAPHLHYEFLVGGVHRNPKTVKLPKAQPVEADEMARFKSTTMPLFARLTMNTTTRLASVSSLDSDSGGE